jgi:endoglucanase
MAFKIKRCLVFLLFVPLVRSWAQTPVVEQGKLHVHKHTICNEGGKPAQLRGISFSWSVWGGKKYYNKEVVAWLVKDFNVNLIRVSMAIEPDSGYLQFPEEQLKLIAPVVDEAIKQGVYVLIDWHDHHADKNVEASKQFFQKMAQRYEGKPNIIYEIWNEPEAVSWQSVKSYAAEIIPIIRRYDKENIIVVGTPRWDQDVDVAAEDPLIGYDNIAYSFHFYASDAFHQEALRAKAEKAMQCGLPLFVTEWGVGEANGDGVFDRQRADRWLEWMERNKLSWANWNLTDKKETTALLEPKASVNGKWKLEELTPAGAYIRNKLKDLQ